MANKKNGWLRKGLMSLSERTGRGINKDIRTIGEALGSSTRKGIEGYISKSRAKKKKKEALGVEIRKAFKDRNDKPWNPKYATPDDWKEWRDIIKEFENK